jgi:integrase/recombinase XerD
MKGARPLGKSEIAAVLECCEGRDKALVLIGLNLGLRVSELVSLQWQDVLDQGRILPLVYLSASVTKGRKPRAVPVNRRAATAILELHRRSCGGQAKPTGYLFPGRDKGHICRRHVNRLLYRVFAEARLGGRLSSHTLRKTFGTLLSERGISLPVIQELLGHADISTTRKYIGVGMSSLQDATRVLAGAY